MSWLLGHKGCSDLSKTALIISPFMNRRHHVGVLRVRRFIRWLKTGGYNIVLVRAGECDSEQVHSWGREICVSDPLGLHPDEETPHQTKQRKEYSPVVEFASRTLFNPDPGIVWGRKAIKSQVVRAAAQKADLIISSSPPESCHVVAMRLARSSQAKLCIDMRDGWLDEPLKVSLGKSALQQRKEGRLEAQILAEAHHIFVTSEIWKEMMLARMPGLESKLTVLTNCYPPGFCTPGPQQLSDEIVLLYTGQFRGSKYNNRPELILNPVLEMVKAHRLRLQIILHGKFTRQDLTDIDLVKQSLNKYNSKLETRSPLEYDAMLRALPQAHGLLLLSATMASLPAKLFEYLPSQRPILAVTPQNSAIWKLADRIPQLYVLPLEQETPDLDSINKFFDACRKNDNIATVPEEFSENYGLHKFLNCL